MEQGEQQLNTLRQLATRYKVSERQADYAARQYGIEPARRVGIIRLFDEHAANQLRSALARIASGKGR